MSISSQQPRWLTCYKSWLRNRMPPHSLLWAGWWPAWGRDVRLRVVLPHATEAPFYGSINNTWNSDVCLLLVRDRVEPPPPNYTKQRRRYQQEIGLNCFLTGEKFFLFLVTFSLGTHPLLSCAVHSTNTLSLQLGHHRKRKWMCPITLDSMPVIWWQQRCDQPNSKF